MGLFGGRPCGGREKLLHVGKRETPPGSGFIGFEFKEIDTVRSNKTTEGHIQNRFVRIYKVIVPTNTSIKIHPDEVSEVQLLDIPAAKQLATDHPDQVSDDFALWLNN